MRIKVYTLDFETPRWLRRTLAYAVPFALVCGVGVVYASVPHTFTAGETLTAAALNDNFADLDGRVGGLEAAPTSITVAGTAEEVGPGSNTPTVYSHADLVLSPGTWLVQGYASLTIAINDDWAALGLFDVSASADVPNSFGAAGAIFVGAEAAALTTAQTLVTVTTPTTLRLKAAQNGASVLTFVDFDEPIVAPTAARAPHKLTAVRLR